MTAPNSGGLYIGTDTGGVHIMTAYVDDVHVYSRALSASEIQAIYNSEK